ncbi:MAG: dynamin family protein [Verrucomicrobiales bacterium]|nr:dynamin family protein [Verrucomicrobiales bacterium]
MLGQNYFNTRSKLGSAVYALCKLGEQCGVNPARLSVLQNLMASLKDPFLFVVVGEVNAGKSTMLNALFGSDFCSSGVLPTTDRINVFKHGKEAHEFEVSDTLMEIYRPDEFLKDFNIVDTPGTNSIESGHQRITEQFLPMADLVLFVFSVTNPWGASAWDLLDRIHHQWKKKIVFVLQQCDLRTDEEVTAILDHLRKTAAHRFGQYFPTFAISARQAFLAKTSGLQNEDFWRQSRFATIEQFISDVVESSEVRLTKLINAWRGACYVLGEIKDKLATASEIIRADNELLSGLEHAAQYQEKRTQGKFEPLFEAFDKSYMAAGLQAEPLLESRFRLLSSLMPPARTVAEMEGLIVATTMKAVRRNIADAAAAVEDDVNMLWERIAEEMQEHFNLQLSVGETGLPDWSAARQKIASDVENRTQEGLKHLRLVEDIGGALARRTRWLWGCLATAAISGLIGGVLAYFQVAPAQFVLLGISVLAILLLAIIGTRSITRIRRQFTDRLEARRENLQLAQREAFREGVSDFYRQFVQMFEPLRAVCQEHREKYEPQLNSIASLEKTLTELELILRPVEHALNERMRQHSAAAGAANVAAAPPKA